MRKEFEIELKVGLFVTIGLALVLASILLLGGANSIFTRQNTYTTHFSSTEGLITGAKVLLGGLRVGVVSDVDFDEETKSIRVEIAIARKYAPLIRVDSKVELSTQGLLGDKFITISMGDSDQPTADAGSEIPSRAGKDLAEFLTKGDVLIASLGSAAASLDQTLKVLNSSGRSETLFQGLAQTSKNLAALSAKLNQDLEKTTRNLGGIMEKINNGTGTLGALVNDPGLYEDVRSLLGGANRNRVIRNLVRKTVKDNEDARSDQR